jgi:hypothetical protein
MRRRSCHLQCETLEARDVPAVTDMTQLAQQFYPAPAPRAFLALNFDGWAGEHIYPFGGNTGNADADIQEILDRVTEEFAPFNVQVRRIQGDGQHYASQGSTTIFVGDNSESPGAWAATPSDSSDYPQGVLTAPNTDDHDVAFVDPFNEADQAKNWNNAKIAQAICHEAGHTFGLGHIRTHGVDDNPVSFDKNAAPDVMSYDSPNQAFLNTTFDITSANYDANDQQVHFSLYNRPWYYTNAFNIPVPVFMQTQNSFTFMNTILAPRDKDDVADVANAKAVDPGWSDSPARVLKSWDTVDAQIDGLDDYDAFTFNAQTADPINITVQPTAGSKLDPVLMIYDEFNDTTALAPPKFGSHVNPNDRSSQLTFNPIPGHSYRFVVGGVDEDSQGGYELKTFAGQVTPGGKLQLTGEPGVATQNITIDALGKTLFVTVNGDHVAFPTKGLTGVTMDTGSSADTVAVYATPKGIPFDLRTGAGSDTITVGRPGTSAAGGPRGYTLDGLGGTLNVDGGSEIDYIDHLFVLDTGTAAGHQYELAADHVGRLGQTEVDYANFETLNLSTGAHGDHVTIRGTPARTAVSVNTWAGNDTIVVGVAGFTGLGAVQGPLSLDGGPSTDTVLLDDSTEPAGQSYMVSADHLIRSGAALISFADIGGITLTTTGQSDTITVDQVSPNIPVRVRGGGGDDTITVNVKPGGTEVNVDGGAGNDSLMVQDVVGGAVVHTIPGAPGAGVVGVHYLTGPSGKVAYVAVETVTQAVETVTQDPDADRSFIQALYHDILGRDGSAAEIDSWLPTLQTSTGRADVADGIERSGEARLATVTRWFQTFVQLAPTVQQLKTWTLVLDQNSEEETLRQLLNATVTFAPGNPGQAQMQQFTALVYQQLLSRAPTAAEVKSAVALLQGGAGELTNALMTGAEYRKRAIRAAFANRLHRKPTASELASLAGGALDLRAIREQIESGPEYDAAGY